MGTKPRLKLSLPMQSLLFIAPNSWERMSIASPTIFALAKRGLVETRDARSETGRLRGFQWRITADGKRYLLTLALMGNQRRRNAG